MNRENNSTEKEMIVAEDITDIKLTQAGYYWEMGFNEFDFTCKIKGEDDVLHMREQRHDEGSGFVIHSEKDDIWERITRKEACKLDDKLQEAIQYGNYHKRIAGLTTVEACKDLEFELMENNNVYLNRVIRKLWSELAATQEEIAGTEPKVVADFRRKTDEMFHRIDGMGASEIEGIVSDYVQSVIFCGQFIHAILFCSLLLRLLSFDFSLRKYLPSEFLKCKKSRWRGGERHRISETALRHFPTKIDKRKTAKAL